LLAPRQAAAQPLRSLDSATGGAPLRPTGLFFYGRTILALAGNVCHTNRKSPIRKDGVSLFLHKIGTIFSRFPGKYGF